MAKVVISGALANKPFNGGEAWVRMSWMNGFRQLGHEVSFIEQIRGCDAEAAQYFRGVVDSFGISDRAWLLDLATGEALHGKWDGALQAAARADLLVNISENLTDASLLGACKRKAYIDIDPGFTQYWHAQRAGGFQLAGHDAYYTIGENIGTPRCAIPTSGIEWRAIRPPVVLEDWPVAPTTDQDRFTTVASWRGAFGRIDTGSQTFGVKAHEFRKCIDLPSRVEQTLEIALDIHTADASDRMKLEQHGWNLVNPKCVASTPSRFREYVQRSAGEFSVAQGIYIETRCGWFSDRTTRYLASGKPAVVQETGFSDHIPSGEGLIAFSTVDEATSALERIGKDYERHSQAARHLAEEYFDSRKVLTRLLNEMNV